MDVVYVWSLTGEGYNWQLLKNTSTSIKRDIQSYKKVVASHTFKSVFFLRYSRLQFLIHYPLSNKAKLRFPQGIFRCFCESWKTQREEITGKIIWVKNYIAQYKQNQYIYSFCIIIFYCMNVIRNKNTNAFKNWEKWLIFFYITALHPMHGRT